MSDLIPACWKCRSVVRAKVRVKRSITTKDRQSVKLQSLSPRRPYMSNASRFKAFPKGITSIIGSAITRRYPSAATGRVVVSASAFNHSHNTASVVTSLIPVRITKAYQAIARE